MPSQNPTPQYSAISCNVDFAALLYGAIDEEGTCDEVWPGAYTPSVKRIREASGSRERLAKKVKTAEPSDAKLEMTPASANAATKVQSRQNKKKRRVRQEELAKYGYSAPSLVRQKHLANAAPIRTELDAATLPAAEGAYTALNEPALLKTNPPTSVSKLIEEGFKYIAVDLEQPNTPRPIVDCNGLIIGHIAHPPKDPSYERDIHCLFDIIIDESDGAFSQAELHHKRGVFPAVNFGFTLPNGFQDPIQLDEKRHKRAINRIRDSAGFKQISGFQNGLFAFWNPGVYTYQKTRVEQVLANNENLKRNAPATVFPTTACNFRNVCCFKHRDTQNCPFSWCAITALGKFDHTKGGHLILWELKLIIEFPHGYTILIPSATITHSNTAVVDGDIRVSVTQYCAGSVLRYADNLFCTDKTLHKTNAPLYARNKKDKLVRWEMALQLLSTLEDLRKQRPTKPPTMFQ